MAKAKKPKVDVELAEVQASAIVEQKTEVKESVQVPRKLQKFLK